MADNDIVTLFLEGGVLHAKKGYNTIVIPEKFLGFAKTEDTLERISLMVCGVSKHINMTDDVDSYLSNIISCHC